MRALLLAFLVACDVPDLPEASRGLAPAPPEDAADPLASGSYAFCHEDGADADQVARWCALLADAPPDVCPGMRKTCEKGDFRATGGCDGGVFEGGGYADGPDGGEQAWQRPPGCEAPDEPDASLLGVALRWGAAFLAALGVVLVARLLLRRLGWLRSAPRPAPAPVEVVPAAIAGDDDLPALPEDAMLAEARAALDDGRLGDAVVWARGAALRRLARQGRLALHRARTDREYLRAVARDADVAGALRAILGAVEDHRFAGRVLTPERAAAAVAAAGRLVAALVLALLLLPGDALAARRYAPNGDAALHRLVGAAGWEVVPVGDTLEAALDDATVLVLDTYAVTPTDADWGAVAVFVDEGGILLLGGDASRFEGIGRHTRASGTDAQGEAGPRLLAAGVTSPRWPGGSTYRYCDPVGEVLVAEVAPPPGGDAPGDDAPTPTDAADCPAPALVVGLPVGLGYVIGIADPIVLRNAAMIVEANRRLVPGLVGAASAALERPADAPRAVLATWAGGAPRPDPWHAVASARLLPFLLHLLAAWALLALAVGWPLSPPREDDAAEVRPAAEHAVALGRHWARLGATRRAAAAYARLELARHGPEGLVALAHRAGRDAGAARALVARAEALAADPDGPDGPDDENLVEELWQLTTRRST